MQRLNGLNAVQKLPVRCNRFQEFGLSAVPDLVQLRIVQRFQSLHEAQELPASRLFSLLTAFMMALDVEMCVRYFCAVFYCHVR